MADRWVGGWADGRMGRWMVGWLAEWIHRCMYVCMYVWMQGRIFVLLRGLNQIEPASFRYGSSVWRLLSSPASRVAPAYLARFLDEHAEVPVGLERHHLPRAIAVRHNRTDQVRRTDLVDARNLDDATRFAHGVRVCEHLQQSTAVVCTRTMHLACGICVGV